MPRRAYRELLVAATGEDLGEDPQAWREWFRKHPVLVWDKEKGHLVDKALKPGEGIVRYDAQNNVICPLILPEGLP